MQDLRLNAKRFDKYSVDDIQRLLDEKEAAEFRLANLSFSLVFASLLFAFHESWALT